MTLKKLSKVFGYIFLATLVMQYIYSHFIIEGPGIVENLVFGVSIFIGLLFTLVLWYQEKKGYTKQLLIIEIILLSGALGFAINMLLAAKNSY